MRPAAVGEWRIVRGRRGEVPLLVGGVETGAVARPCVSQLVGCLYVHKREEEAGRGKESIPGDNDHGWSLGHWVKVGDVEAAVQCGEEDGGREVSMRRM